MSTDRLKDFTKGLLSFFPLTSSRTRAIFTYHDISFPSEAHHSPHYSTTPDRFFKQMEFIRWHFDLVDLEELFAEPKTRSGKPLASITFDDGFRSVKEKVLPFFSDNKIPITAFVNAGAMIEDQLTYSKKYSAPGRKPEYRVYMDECDIRMIENGGARIGNHSFSHKVLSECDPVTLGNEIIGNKHYLESFLKNPIRHLALPYGKAAHYNREVIDVSRRSGHEFIYSSNPAPFRAKSVVPEHNLIPRIGLTNESTEEVCFLINRAIFKTINL